ncbi:MAG: hypothetical protein M1830_009262 [Pleopsidium flavum]|nr:MAG: hypothetical protein M1830_009262 [Pleopsidium flavum]
MKLRRRPSPLILLILPALSAFPVSLAVAHRDKSENSIGSQQVAREAAPPKPAYTYIPDAPLIATLKSEIGTKDAPVDGKDGKPHAGPFVETAAERERKKAKESVEGKISTGTKPLPKPLNAPHGGVSYSEDSKIPESNDGVMDDPNRVSPKEGTRGTEGGVSEKDRDRKAQEGQIGAKTEKKPDPPKEAPPLPHSEEEGTAVKEAKEAGRKGKDLSAEEMEKTKAVGGLEKPTDLPEKPHDIPHPIPPGSQKDDPLEIGNPVDHPKLNTPSAYEEGSGLIHPLHSFILSLTMIIFSEIGDKTFLIAALMAMKHPRLLVFSAAFSALIAMTILSAVLGHAVPTLIPKRFTNFLAAILFLAFGAKMLREGYAMHPGEGVGEEMKEVEMELEEREHLARKIGRRRSSISPYVLESGRGAWKARSNSRLPLPPESPSSSSSRSPSPSRSSAFANALAGLNNLFSLLLSPAWVQTFIMTFLGEWGDRSQIATIAMAAGQDYWWVTGGAVSGHALCTAAAVIGGRAIAGRVSLRVVTLGGAFAFVVFGLIYLVEAVYYF